MLLYFIEKRYNWTHSFLIIRNSLTDFYYLRFFSYLFHFAKIQIEIERASHFHSLWLLALFWILELTVFHFNFPFLPLIRKFGLFLEQCSDFGGYFCFRTRTELPKHTHSWGSAISIYYIYRLCLGTIIKRKHWI